TGRVVARDHRASLPKRFRRAKVNVVMIVVLCALAAASGGYWIYRIYSGSAETRQAAAEGLKFNLYCSSCKKEILVAGDKTSDIKKDKEGRLRCPECKQFTGTWGQAPVETKPGEKAPGFAQP